MEKVKSLVFKYLLFFVFTFSATSATAGDAPTHLVVTFVDDTQVTIPIERRPVILPGEETLGFKIDDIVTEYANETVSHFALENLGHTSTQKISANDRNVRYSDHTALFSGFPEGAVLTMTTMDGKPCLVRSFDSKGCMEIDLSAYPKGIYLIHAMDKTIKLLVE